MKTENTELKEHLVKSSELEDQNTKLLQTKSSLQEQISKLTNELDTVKDNEHRVKTEMDSLVKKAEKLNKETERLQAENAKLLAKQADDKRTLQSFQSLETENSKLQATIDELRAKGATSAPASSAGNKALEDKITSLEKDKTILETALEEWTDLAKVSNPPHPPLTP